MKQKWYKKGEVIFRERSFDASMYDIRTGGVSIYAQYQTPEERKLAELHAGNFFGEMGLVEGFSRSATAVASEDGTCVNEITDHDFNEYLREEPEQVLAVMRHMGARLRDLTSDYNEVCASIRQLESVEPEDAARKKGVLSALAEQLRKFSEAYNESVKYLSGSGNAAMMGMWTTGLY